MGAFLLKVGIASLRSHICPVTFVSEKSARYRKRAKKQRRTHAMPTRNCWCERILYIEEGTKASWVHIPYPSPHPKAHPDHQIWRTLCSPSHVCQYTGSQWSIDKRFCTMQVDVK